MINNGIWSVLLEEYAKVLPQRLIDENLSRDLKQPVKRLEQRPTIPVRLFFQYHSYVCVIHIIILHLLDVYHY